MSSFQGSLSCSGCGLSNPPVAKFCQKCGTRLVQTCPRCGADCLLEVKYCATCGITLAEAKPGLTNDRAQQWWQHFETSFPDFHELWLSHGKGSKIARDCDRVTDGMDETDAAMTQVRGLALPIADMDWCVHDVQMNTALISHGLVEVKTAETSICDLTQRKRHRIFHEDLEEVRLEGNTLTLVTRGGRVTKLRLRIPRPSALAAAELAVESLVNNLGTRDWAEQELTRQNWRPRADKHRQKHEIADAYARSIYELFAEIVGIISDHAVLQSNHDLPGLDTDSVDVIRSFIAAANRKDLGAILDMMHPQSPRLEKTTAEFKEAFHRHDLSYEVSQPSGSVHNDGSALVFCRLKVTSTGLSGFRDYEANMSFVLRQQLETWRIYNLAAYNIEYLDTCIGPQGDDNYHLAARTLTDMLQQRESERFQMLALLKDYRSLNLARYFEATLVQAGWQSDGISEVSLSEVPRSVVLEVPADKPAYREFMRFLHAIGLDFEREEASGISCVRIIIGVPVW